MTFSPVLPMWSILLTGAVAIGVLALVYRRPSLPAALRLALVLGIVALLANPTRVRPESTPRMRTVAIVTDCSGSMGQTDLPDGRSRGAHAREAANSLATDLGPGWRVVRLGLSQQLLSPPSLVDAGDSDFNALGELPNQSPKVDAAVLLSDGADWLGGDPETSLIAAGIPVYTIGVGSTRRGANTAVELQVPSPNLTPGQDVALMAVVTASADLAGRQAELVVEAAEDPQHPRELLRTQVTLSEWQQIAVPANAGSALGGRRWRATLTPVPGEITVVDNTAWTSAQVVDRTLRILVLEGRPCWDMTFAVRAWRRDRQLEVTTAYTIAKRLWRAGDIAVPTTAESLKNIDVLVLGQDVEHLVSSALIQPWVDAGGRLLLMGTAPAPQLAALDPLVPAGIAVPIIVTGGDTDGLLPEGVRLPALSAPAALQPQARVLLGERSAPLIASKRFGQGLTCRVDLDGFWRWHLIPLAEASDPGAGRERGERFCRQLLRSIARTPSGDLWAERLRVAVGDSAALWTRPDAHISKLEHIRPDGSRTPLVLTDCGARPRLEQPGCHRFIAGSAEVAVIVEQRLGEQVNASRDDGRLRRLAERTGGEFHDLTEAAAVTNKLKAQRQLAALPDAATRNEPVITERWWLWALLALAAGEWWIRRRHHGVV